MKDSLPCIRAAEISDVIKSPVTDKLQQRIAILALHRAGISNLTVATFSGGHVKTVHRWISRVEAGGTIEDMPRSGRPRRFPEQARLKTIAVYCQQAPPLAGVHRWSLRDAERYFKEHAETIGGTISRATIQRILKEHVLQPHRRKYYLQITDPNFFSKMENIVECYRHPPENLYCFDECTCIQALSRLTPDLPVTADQPVLEDFDYKRNGITDLLAFLDPRTGNVYGQCTANHNRHTLSRVFTAQVKTHPDDAVLHYIMDNLTTHYHDDFCRTIAQLSNVPYAPLKTGAERRQWLQSEDKRIVVHFLPFHASWLNMVEIWFGILKGKCLNYGHFSSVEQLRRDIMDFITTWNECFAHPFNWSYTGEGLHGKAVRRFCRLLAIETDQMDSKFLKSQLLLMCTIADKYLDLVAPADWQQLLQLIVEKERYLTDIIEAEPGPHRRKKARKAYIQFCDTVRGPLGLLTNVG